MYFLIKNQIILSNYLSISTEPIRIFCRVLRCLIVKYDNSFALIRRLQSSCVFYVVSNNWRFAQLIVNSFCIVFVKRVSRISRKFKNVYLRAELLLYLWKHSIDKYVMVSTNNVSNLIDLAWSFWSPIRFDRFFGVIFWTKGYWYLLCHILLSWSSYTRRFILNLQKRCCWHIHVS